MALSLNLVNEKGVVSGYHKIIAVSEVYIGEAKGISVNLASYVSQEYRLQDEEKMIVSNLGILLPFGETEDYTRGTLYTRIVAEVTEFAEAVEV